MRRSNGVAAFSDPVMRHFALVAVAMTLALPCQAWISAPASQALRTSGIRSASTSRREGTCKELSMVTRREAVALGIGTSIVTCLPLDAGADMTLNSFKRAYFRWVPRIEAGRDFFVLELGSQIENEQWAEVDICLVVNHSLACFNCYYRALLNSSARILLDKQLLVVVCFTNSHRILHIRTPTISLPATILHDSGRMMTIMSLVLSLQTYGC